MFALCPVFTIGVTNLGWRLVCQISSLVIITLCLPTCYVLASTSREQLPIEADENQSDFVKEKIESDVLQKGEIRVVRKKDLAHTLHVPAIWIFSLTTILFVLCMAFVMISLVRILRARSMSSKIGKKAQNTGVIIFLSIIYKGNKSAFPIFHAWSFC